MVSYEHKFVFIHIPKTGGVTLYDRWDVRRLLHGHFTFEEHRDCKTSPRGFGDDYFKFTFVRNPWDRFLSAYAYYYGGTRDPDSNGWRPWVERIRKYDDFKDFARHFEDEVSEPFARHRHFLPQVFWFDPAYTFDFIGRFEKFNDDVITLCRHLGLPDHPPERKNKSDHPPYQDAYDDETRAIVERVYAEDIQRFGYTFD